MLYRQLEMPLPQLSEEAFENRIVLVTGAASGIGRAVSLALAKRGATVLMLDKKARHLEKLHDQIEQGGSPQPVILPFDLEQLDAGKATQIAQAIYDDFSRLDGLLHNAAELGSPSPMDQYDLQYWQQVMQVNLHAPYLLTRALLPLLKQEQATQLLYTSADVGSQPMAYWGAYSIAYAGIEAQAKLWAEELDQTCNIHVNCIDPGPVRTGMRRRSHPGESQSSLASPAELAPSYLFLLSELNRSKGAFYRLQK